MDQLETLFGRNVTVKRLHNQMDDLLQYSMKVLFRCDQEAAQWVKDLPDWDLLKQFQLAESLIMDIAVRVLGQRDQEPFYGDLRLFLLNSPEGQRVNTTDKPDPDVFKNTSNPYFVKKLEF